MEVIEDVTFEEALNQIRKLNIPPKRHVRIVVHDLDEPKNSPSIQTKIDPVIAEFLNNIDNIAVDTGIPDLADQHDHYLFFLPN